MKRLYTSNYVFELPKDLLTERNGKNCDFLLLLALNIVAIQINVIVVQNSPWNRALISHICESDCC